MSDPISESPAAYALEMRRRIERNKISMFVRKEVSNVEDMTVEEQREYYDTVGKSKLEDMDAAGQQNMFDRFLQE